MAERTSSLRTKEEGSPRQFRQNGRVVGKTTGWSLGHHWASCSYDGHPCQSHGQELRGIEPSSHHDSRHQPHQLTSTSPSSKTQAQSASIPFAYSPFDDSHHLHFDPLHHDSQHPSFQGFRIIQTRMMVLTILHGLRPNPKLKSILEGCADLQHLWGTTLHSHNLFSRQFFQPQSVYIRFTHIQNMQPKFYLGSAMHHTLDREYSRSRKYFQLTHERLVQAELALRYWHEHDNLYIWAPIPIYTDRVDYRSLEVALIQEWQPRLNYPFICQFYHPKKGLLKKPLLNTNAQFGLATLWRRAKHKFTPQLVRQVLTSSRFQNRLELWTIVHALGSNTKARFEQTKMLRSNDGGLLLCYALRRLANNTQEPFRTLSLTAIDASIKWWHGKPCP